MSTITWFRVLWSDRVRERKRDTMAVRIITNSIHTSDNSSFAYFSLSFAEHCRRPGLPSNSPDSKKYIIRRIKIHNGLCVKGSGIFAKDNWVNGWLLGRYRQKENGILSFCSPTHYTWKCRDCYDNSWKVNMTLFWAPLFTKTTKAGTSYSNKISNHCTIWIFIKWYLLGQRNHFPAMNPSFSKSQKDKNLTHN